MPKRPRSPFENVVDQPGYPGRDWMSRYLRRLEEEEGRLRVSSRRAYESIWRAFLVFLAERGLDPVRASAGAVREYLLQHHRDTALRYGRLLQRVYEQPVAHREVPLNPFAELQELLAGAEKRPVTPAISVGDLQTLIDALPKPADWQEHRDQAVLVLAAAAGLRFRELRELTSLQLMERSRGLEVQPRGRTARSREILLDPQAAEFLRGWLSVRRQLDLPGDLVFPGSDGRAIPSNTFYRRLRRLLESVCGEHLPRFGVGVLRATFAERFKETEDIPRIQYALGHRRITSTLRYLKQLRPIAPGKLPRSA